MSDLSDFFKTYSLTDIVIIVAAAAGGFLFLARVWDEAATRIRKLFDKENRRKSTEQRLNQRIQELEDEVEEVKGEQSRVVEAMEFLTSQLAMLVDSDKDSIKAYLTDKHHYYFYKQGWIDDYNRDCIERRYVHYKKAGGNSFVDHLMEEIRSLPTQQPTASKSEGE